MITYNYFGIDYEFNPADFPQDGDAFLNAIHKKAQKLYNEQAQEIIDEHFDMYKKKADTHISLHVFTKAQRKFPDTTAIAVIWSNRDMTSEEFRKKYRIVVATGYEDRETGQIHMTDFF